MTGEIRDGLLWVEKWSICAKSPAPAASFLPTGYDLDTGSGGSMHSSQEIGLEGSNTMRILGIRASVGAMAMKEQRGGQNARGWWVGFCSSACQLSRFFFSLDAEGSGQKFRLHRQSDVCPSFSSIFSCHSPVSPRGTSGWRGGWVMRFDGGVSHSHLRYTSKGPTPLL